eukprot:762511-Hanusia_phi.AAC.1
MSCSLREQQQGATSSLILYPSLAGRNDRSMQCSSILLLAYSEGLAVLQLDCTRVYSPSSSQETAHPLLCYNETI